MKEEYNPIQFKDHKLILLDQRVLPLEEVFHSLETLEQAHWAIKEMIVRGAPCIGFTAIFGMALWLKNHQNFTTAELNQAGDYLKSARPTAVNLNFEVDRVIAMVQDLTNQEAYEKVVSFGHLQISKSETENRAMAKTAYAELEERLGKKKYNILTHCNTGFLACGSIGTALGVVQHLHENDQLELAWVDETRPYLQGSRLTAYELVKLGAPHKVVVEGAASYLMKTGQVDAIFTGADRIVANGDTANKVGTSNLSILAKHYNIPFYIVAPSSSFDLSIQSGEKIEIELRDENEILSYKNNRIAPIESTAFNPSFDITDGQLITGIINEKGIAQGNYLESLPRIVHAD
ncbi:MAG: S-methyl-5-thioribose-1-phosphate isomerase [Halobacteriovoraceae bacterium]|nr:S-methyl-5-thioribose-1-phosphate isomerase [Halobacteriovoraceae bacterium]